MNGKEFFLEAQSGVSPSSSLKLPLQALWFDAQGHWEKAHECVQEESDFEAAWVHAYLHRKEGDHSNARYWYRKAGKVQFEGDLQEEWEAIASTLLSS